MKKSTLTFVAAICFCVVLVPAQEHPSSLIAGTPQWEKIKTLAGEWDGYALENGQKMPTHISVRMTGDGSALMHWMDAGSPHEMITMFHPDKAELLATHYCAAHNQPRMRATASSKPSQIAFEFMDGMNIRPGDGFMRQLIIDLVDADHHNETWGFDVKGKIQAGTFYLTRSKKPAKQ
jgi:hypothetical protein